MILENLHSDLQQIFFIVHGEFISLLLGIFAGSGMVLALVMSLARYWRYERPVQVTFKDQD